MEERAGTLNRIDSALWGEEENDPCQSLVYRFCTRVGIESAGRGIVHVRTFVQGGEEDVAGHAAEPRLALTNPFPPVTSLVLLIRDGESQSAAALARLLVGALFDHQVEEDATDGATARPWLDARAWTAAGRVARWVDIPQDTFARVAQECAQAYVMRTGDLDRADRDPSTSLVRANSTWRRRLAVGASAVGAGVLIAATAGLAAPAVAAVAGVATAAVTGAGGSAAVTAAVGGAGAVLTTPAVVATGFGTYGASVVGSKMETRLAGLQYLTLIKLPVEGEAVELGVERTVATDEMEIGDGGGDANTDINARTTPHDLDTAATAPPRSSQQIRTPTVTLYISGLVTQESDFTEPWRGLNRVRGIPYEEERGSCSAISINRRIGSDSNTKSTTSSTPEQSGSCTEHYAVVWEPEEVQRLGQKMESIIISEMASRVRSWALSAVGGVLYASAMAPLWILKWSDLIDSPWTITVQRAKAMGQELANSVLRARLLGGRPVHLVASSVGCLALEACLLELESCPGGAGVVASAIFLGSPQSPHVPTYRRMRSIVAGRLVNAYSTRDWLLAILVRAWSLTDLKSVGLSGLMPVVGVPGLENVDLTEIVSEHFNYKTKLTKIMSMVQGTEEGD